MRKILFGLLLFPLITQAQLTYPTETIWQFLGGYQAGANGTEFNVGTDGDISTLKGLSYDFPDSLRVVSPGSRYYLTGTYSAGSYDLDWRRPSKADVSDLTANQILYGGASGAIAQSQNLLFDAINGDYDFQFSDDGFHVDVQDGTSVIHMAGGYDYNWTFTNDGTAMLMSGTISSAGDMPVSISSSDFTLYDNSATKYFLYYKSSNQRIGIGTNTPAVDFHLVADTVRFEGLDGTGSRLNIDNDGNITRTANSSVYQITLVAADQVNASSDEIIGISGSGNFAIVGQASRRQVNMAHDGSFTFASVGLATSQPATGDLVMTLYKNGSPTSMVLTIPANTPLGSYITTTQTVTFVEGDYFYWYATNGASTNSGLLNSVSLLTHYND